ncbi:uncharacterized protein [Amphiura filiformis]|uniref:uncharacterized protein n=1 Tax=Amphiura filiformis TaxID=82378 RepID=UPI003B218E36
MKLRLAHKVVLKSPLRIRNKYLLLLQRKMEIILPVQIVPKKVTTKFIKSKWKKHLLQSNKRVYFLRTGVWFLRKRMWFLRKAVCFLRKGVWCPRKGVWCLRKAVWFLKKLVWFRGKTAPMSVCRECFQDEPTMEIHKHSHTSDKPYPCEQCQKSFTDLNKLIEHIKKDKTHRKPNNCPICDNVFTKSCSVPNHVICHYKIQPYSCTRCDKRFAIRSSLNAHMAWHDGKYKCDECGQHCQTKNILKLHKRKHSDTVLYTCQLCTTGFKHEKSFKKHICLDKDKGRTRNDEAPKPFVCAHCGSSYRGRYELLVHERRNHGPTPPERFPCEHCDKSYLDKKTLKNHIMAVHSDNGNPFACLCVACGKTYVSKECLKIHERAVHSTVKPFQCTTCKQGFSSSSGLSVHIAAKHKNHRPHLCPYCGARFVSRSTLTGHMRSHTKETPYTCQFCDKSFTLLQTWKRHVRIHTGELPYKCAECGNQFRTTEMLNIHKKVTHTKDNPNVCDICSKICATAGALQAHMNYHTRPFKCITCGKGFATRWRVKDHQKTHNKPEEVAPKDSQDGNTEAGNTLTGHMPSHTKETHNKPESRDNTNESLDNTNVCDICNKICATAGALRAHMKYHTRPFMCFTCMKGFPDHWKLKRHQKTHNKPEEVAPKDSQDGNTEAGNTLTGHMPSHTKETHNKPESRDNTNESLDNPNVCDICNKICATAGALRAHMKYHTRPFMCFTCGKGFIDRWKLKRHQKTHNKPEKVAPKDSQDGNTEAGNTLTGHMRSHTKRHHTHVNFAINHLRCCKHGKDT